MKAHEAINSCLADDAVNEVACFFENHLVCKKDGCLQQSTISKDLIKHGDTHKALKERKLPRFRCICGCYWRDNLDKIATHHRGKRHEKAMAATAKGSSETWQENGAQIQIRLLIISTPHSCCHC